MRIGGAATRRWRSNPSADDPPARGSPAVRAAPRERRRPSRSAARWRPATDARPAGPDNSTISRCSGTDRHEGTRRPPGSRATAPAAYDAYAIPQAAMSTRLPTVTTSRRIDPGSRRQRDEPVGRHGDRRDDGGDEARVEVRQRHRHRRGAKQADGCAVTPCRDSATTRASTAAATGSARREGDRRRAPDEKGRTRRPSPRRVAADRESAR